MTVALSDGTVFAARYRVVRRIAMGGMGAVYEVTHLETERRLALKVMLPHIVQSAEMRERFRREARVAATVESEHIVDVLDAGVDDATGMPFLVMELLRGEELSQTLKRVGRLGPIETITILHQTSLALDKTHRASIVHRDLKPENLFLTEREDGQPRVKVLDFGIAKLLAEGSTQDPGTRSLGTPLYMAPEQFRAGQPISAATDLYALGMIAYTMLVGASYWAEEAKDSSNVFMFAGSVMAGARQPPTERARKLGVELPPAFDAWFARATAMAASDRFPAASVAVAALAEALGVQPPASAFSVSGTGPFRPSGGFGLVATPSGAARTGPQGTDDPATWLYAGSQPRLSSSGPASATGPTGGIPGSASTGSAYGSATGAPAPSNATGKIVAAIAVGIAIGGVGLAALFLLPTGPASSTGAATGPASSAVATTTASAEPPATAAPSASASASAEPSVTASAEPSATASASAEPPTTAAAARPAPKHATPAPPPRKPGKKSIYVRD